MSPKGSQIGGAPTGGVSKGIPKSGAPQKAVRSRRYPKSGLPQRRVPKGGAQRGSFPKGVPLNRGAPPKKTNRGTRPKKEGAPPPPCASPPPHSPHEPVHGWVPPPGRLPWAAASLSAPAHEVPSGPPRCWLPAALRLRPAAAASPPRRHSRTGAAGSKHTALAPPRSRQPGSAPSSIFFLPPARPPGACWEM